MTDSARLIAELRAGLPRIDPSLANAARVWNYLAGGKDNFEADRAAARQMIMVAPVLQVTGAANRAFFSRAVRYLAGQAGVRQFIKIGTSLWPAGSAHEVAQSVVPQCRVVYADSDPVVLLHARAMFTCTAEGAIGYINADARNPGTIITEAGATLDFAEPVAFLLAGSLSFIEDNRVAASCVAALTAAAARGSYLAIIQPAGDLDPALREAEWHWNQMSAQRTRLRTRDEVAGFLAGLNVLEPGLVTVAEWRPDAGEPVPGQQIPMYAAVARKP